MTDYEKKMVEGYIPSPPDPTLEAGEYYILDDYDRVQKVFIRDINPDMRNDRTVYGVRYCSTGNRYNGGYGYGHTPMSSLYDNKQDCRDQTHMMYDYWEHLRELVKKEAADPD